MAHVSKHVLCDTVIMNMHPSGNRKLQ